MTWAIFDDSHYRAIGEIITTGSERVVAVVSGAFLEETVERTLKERLRDAPDVIKILLKPERPLGNIAPQIDLLHLLYAFDDPTRKTLKGIAAVRNFFAHNLDATFESDEVVKGIDRLVLHENKSHYPNPRLGGDSNEPIEPIENRRTRFIVNLKLGLLELMRDRVSHRLHTNEMLTDEDIRSQFPEGRTP
jgi:hypothetical protein